MKQILMISIIVALVLTLSIINANGISFAQSDSDTTGRQILCIGTGLGMLASGVPLPAVIGAGQLAHQNEICP